VGVVVVDLVEGALPRPQGFCLVVLEKSSLAKGPTGYM